MFVTFGSALIRHFEKHERTVKRSQEKDYSFFGNDMFPDLYDALVYERKFKSEYSGRQFTSDYLIKREPSIVKHIENRSDLSNFKAIYIE